MLHLNLGKQERVLLQLLRGEALPQLWDSMDQDPEPIAVIPGLEDPIRLGPTRWDLEDQWMDLEVQWVLADQWALEVQWVLEDQ